MEKLFNDEPVFEMLSKDPSRLKRWEVYFIDKLISLEIWLQKNIEHIEELGS